MGVQDLTVQMVVIVVIGVFFASFMDAIAGGGGIISVPTYLLAGLPMHFALGTNKFSSSIGTSPFSIASPSASMPSIASRTYSSPYASGRAVLSLSFPRSFFFRHSG